MFETPWNVSVGPRGVLHYQIFAFFFSFFVEHSKKQGYIFRTLFAFFSFRSEKKVYEIIFL